MLHPKQIEIERRMKKMFDKIDEYLENEYGEIYRIHPNRPKHGQTFNSQSDGLFNIGADFTPGFGSHLGRGYIVRIHIATLETVAADFRTQLTKHVEKLVRELLPQYFPERNLDLAWDGAFLKITGDFHLGFADID